MFGESARKWDDRVMGWFSEMLTCVLSCPQLPPPVPATPAGPGVCVLVRPGLLRVMNSGHPGRMWRAPVASVCFSLVIGALGHLHAAVGRARVSSKLSTALRRVQTRGFSPLAPCSPFPAMESRVFCSRGLWVPSPRWGLSASHSPSLLVSLSPMPLVSCPGSRCPDQGHEALSLSPSGTASVPSSCELSAHPDCSVWCRNVAQCSQHHLRRDCPFPVVGSWPLHG